MKELPYDVEGAAVAYGEPVVATRELETERLEGTVAGVRSDLETRSRLAECETEVRRSGDLLRRLTQIQFRCYSAEDELASGIAIGIDCKESKEIDRKAGHCKVVQGG